MSWTTCEFCKRRINGEYNRRDHIRQEHQRAWLVARRQEHQRGLLGEELTEAKAELAKAIVWLANYREMQEELPGLPRLPQAYAALRKVLSEWPYSRGEEWLIMNGEWAEKRVKEAQAALAKYDEEHGGTPDRPASHIAVAGTG